GVAPSLQQVQSAAEPVEQLLRGQQRRPRGCELERERQVVETRAQLVEAVVRLEVRLRSPGSRDEEPPGLLPCENRYRVDLFTLDAQPFAAGDEHVRVGTGREQVRHVRRGP